MSDRAKKTYDDASFRRPGRGQYLEVPRREENPGSIGELTYEQWYSRNRSRESSVHSVTSEDNIDFNKPSSKPFFIVPYAPTQYYLHREMYEDALYDALSVGGTRIAFIGEAGVGYGISVCTYM
jgi:hypothetical protein